MAQAPQTESVASIHLQGGYYDGAAHGQETDTIITADDLVKCTYSSLFWEEGETEPDIFKHSDVVPGNFAKMVAELEALNVLRTKPIVENKSNFLVKLQQGRQLRFGLISVVDDDQRRFGDFLMKNPHPCWLFG